MKKVQPWMFAGLQHWADAHDLATLYEESILSTRSTDNGPVGGWQNKGIAGGAYVQASDPLRPTLKFNYINGLPAVVGNGSDTYLRKAATPVIAQPITIYLVSKVATVQNNRAWFDGGDSAATRVRLATNGTNNLVLDSGTVVAGPLVDASAHVWTVIVRPSASEVYMDGVLELTGNVGTNSIGGLTILGNRANGGVLNGGVGELIIYEGQHTEEQRQLLEAYLRRKWKFVK